MKVKDAAKQYTNAAKDKKMDIAASFFSDTLDKLLSNSSITRPASVVAKFREADHRWRSFCHRVQDKELNENALKEKIISISPEVAFHLSWITFDEMKERLMSASEPAENKSN